MTEEMTVQADVEKAAKERNLDPLMERSFLRLLSEVPKRLLTVTMKLLSMKGITISRFLIRYLSGKALTSILAISPKNPAK